MLATNAYFKGLIDAVVGSPVLLAALIGASAALFVSFVNSLIQWRIASTKLKVDRSGELIDEFSSDVIYEARFEVDKALKASSEKDIDLFVDTLCDEQKKHLSRIMNYLEKLEGLVESKRADAKLLRTTLGNKVAWWYVFLVERFQDSDKSEWYPLLLKLKKLEGLYIAKDYLHWKEHSLTIVRRVIQPTEIQANQELIAAIPST